MQGRVESLLFDGANSRVMVRDTRTGHEITVTLPQTGEFADLGRGRPVHLGWTRAQAKCFAVGDKTGEAAAQ
jgi:spermidine/putrescine transport system ATP-binding protein